MINTLTVLMVGTNPIRGHLGSHQAGKEELKGQVAANKDFRFIIVIVLASYNIPKPQNMIKVITYLCQRHITKGLEPKWYFKKIGVSLACNKCMYLHALEKELTPNQNTL